MPSFSCVLRWGLVGGAPVSRGSKGLGGSPIGEVATRYGTTRQSLDSWRTRFKQEGTWIQAVAATNVDGSESSRWSSSAGVRQPWRFLGRALSSAATWSSQPGP